MGTIFGPVVATPLIGIAGQGHLSAASHPTFFGIDAPGARAY
jgi:hypothetical protein